MLPPTAPSQSSETTTHRPFGLHPRPNARALSTPPNSLSRFAACYFQLPSQSKEFYIDVNLASDTAHRVTLYCLDWDRLGRKEKIEIVDPIANKTLHTYNLDSFGDGKYLTWEVRGHVLIKVIWIDSPTSTIDNPVVSGIFLDPVPDAFPTVSITSPENGTVVGNVQITATASG
jgi:hypothetical protein